MSETQYMPNNPKDNSLDGLEMLIDQYKAEPTEENARAVIELKDWLFEDDDTIFDWAALHSEEGDSYAETLNQITAETAATGYDEVGDDHWDQDAYDFHKDL